MRSLAIDLLRSLATVPAADVAALGAACGTRRVALERTLAALAAAGWARRDGDRVRRARPYDFLDAGTIEREIAGPPHGLEVDVVDACASTNSALLGRAQGAGARLLLAEEQTAGRGRRGRRWHSATGAGLTLSLARRMRCAPRDLAALSLVAGVAAVRALRGLGAHGVALKWPNDLLLGDAKLGGILAETRIRGAAVVAVVGVGLNCRGTPGLGERLRRRIASLEDVLRPLPSRNVVAARLAVELLGALETFERSGLAAFRGAWEEFDACRGRRLRIRTPAGRVLAGFADGLAEDGALRLRTRAGVRAVRSGHVVAARLA